MIDINNVYICLVFFILFGTFTSIMKVYSEIIFIIIVTVIVNDEVNYCTYVILIKKTDKLKVVKIEFLQNFFINQLYIDIKRIILKSELI